MSLFQQLTVWKGYSVARDEVWFIAGARVHTEDRRHGVSRTMSRPSELAKRIAHFRNKEPRCAPARVNQSRVNPPTHAIL
jgi:hypothetical protein